MDISRAKQEELDLLKDLKQLVTSGKSTSIVIYGDGGNITLHSKNGAPQNEGLFDGMMKALKDGLTEKINKASSKK